MVHILDNNAASLLIEIEGEGFDPYDENYSLSSCIAEYKLRIFCVPTFDDEEEMNDYFEWLNDISIGTIYGKGGWNRYHVFGDGEIRISKYHCYDKAVEKAIELGFKTN